MADYSAFEKGLARWLKAVWANRASIKSSVNSKGRTEGAWCVYDCYNNPASSADEGSRWRKFLKLLVEIETTFSVEGRPQDGDTVPNDFYHFGPASLPPGQGEWRVYAHVKAPRNDHWYEPACLLLKLMASGGSGIAKFKVAGPGMAPDRGDQIVVWTNSEQACKKVLEALSRMAEHFDGNVPPSVATVVAGLGWAKEPSGAHSSPAINEVWGTAGHSFGSYLSAIIYMALEQSWNGTEDNYVEEVEEFFLNVGVNPMKPHLLRTMSWDDIVRLAQQANRSLSGTVIPSLASGKDSTKVVPII